jgi:cold shock CspA family protein
MARKSGKLTQWDDDRGFGFIAGDDGQRNFVHISGIKRSAIRPQPGDRVTYVPGSGKDGRPAATSVRHRHRSVLRRARRPVRRRWASRSGSSPQRWLSSLPSPRPNWHVPRPGCSSPT